MSKNVEIPYELKCPRNDDELKDYIAKVYSYKIPDVAVVEGNVSPFKFISDAFFEKVSDFIVVANRGGSKTTCISILHSLNMNFKPGCKIGTVGAIKPQALRCYNMFRKLIKPYYEYDRIAKSTMMETLFNSPLDTSLEVLIGTMAGMNSPHPPKTFFDEVELASSWEIIQEFFNMSMQTRTLIKSADIKSQIFLISTRKYSYGYMERILSDREEMGFNLYVWSIWEIGERCERESCFECSKIVKGLNADGSPRTFKDVCGGKLKKSNGYRPVDDVIKTFRRLDPKTWEAQQECLKPSNKGAVFYWFDEDKHVLKNDILDENGKEIEYKSNQIKIYEGIDWGGSHPNVCVWWAEYKGNFIMFDEIYITDTAPSDFADMILRKREFWGIEDKIIESYCDPSGKLNRLELEKKGITTVAAKNDIFESISIINSLGVSNRIYIVGSRCPNAVREFKGLHFPNETALRSSFDKPVDKDNHTVDGSRYVFLEVNPVDNSFSILDLIFDKNKFSLTPVDKYSTRRIFGLDDLGDPYSSDNDWKRNGIFGDIGRENEKGEIASLFESSW